MTRSPTIYALYIDLEGAVDFRFDAYDEMSLQDFLLQNFEGRPLPIDWVMPKHTVGNARGQLRDFVQGYTKAPFVSQRVRDCLLPLLGDAAEFRYIGELLGIPYFVLNVTKVHDCLDKARSNLVRASDGRVLTLRQATFEDQKMPLSPLFKVPEDLGQIFANREFVEIIRDEHFSGVGFEFADRIGLGKIVDADPGLPLRFDIRTIHL